MAHVTRRGFIKNASAGAATVGALATLPGITAHAAQSVTQADLAATGLREPIAAFVRDARSGEVAVLIGTREIVVHDPKLVMRLLKIAHAK
jgi:hypothetical protein